MIQCVGLQIGTKRRFANAGGCAEKQVKTEKKSTARGGLNNETDYSVKQ